MKPKYQNPNDKQNPNARLPKNLFGGQAKVQMTKSKGQSSNDKGEARDWRLEIRDWR